ncbi:virulence factor TspB C-terminal domain-related protein [Undibacterium sp. TJN25]|uniref:virulence factor TspB C-terminal domain-related protein n=1 Tax=Undibacterium sp. TJN25 TaxID=3413056 RepID=UPI003BF15E23
MQQQRKQYCEDHDDKNPQVVLGKQLLSGDDPMKSTLPTIDNAQKVDLGQGNLDSSGWGMSGSCLQDKTINAMGQTVILPLSKLCDVLLAFRAAIMLLASMASYRMVSGAVLRS